MIPRTPPSWVLPSIALLYAGMLLGVSFVAVPAKFLAHSIDLPQALDVGRQTFRVFGWVEVACASALVTVSLLHGRGRTRWWPALVLALVGAQILLIRPSLDKRVDLIMQGAEVVLSSQHNIYGVMEIGKLALLATIAWAARPQDSPGLCNRSSPADSVVAGGHYP